MEKVVIRYSLQKLFQNYLVLLVAGIPISLALLGYSMKDKGEIHPKTQLLLQIGTLVYFLGITLYFLLKRRQILSKSLLELSANDILVLGVHKFQWNDIYELNSLTKEREVHSQNSRTYIKQRFKVLRINNQEFELLEENSAYTFDELIQVITQFKSDLEGNKIENK